MVQTKFYWDKEQRIRQPVEARGKGLPSNFSNAVCAAGGSVWVGTIAGLGYGRSLHDWNFLRGRDYKRKNAGLWLDTGEPSAKTGERVLYLIPRCYRKTTSLVFIRFPEECGLDSVNRGPVLFGHRP